MLSSLFLGIGFVLMALALLRGLQEETGEHLTNHLTWIPYVVTMIGCAVIVAFSLYAINKEKRRSERRHRERLNETSS